MALFNQGRYAEGEALAKELTARFPQNATGWKVLGVMLVLQGRSAEAVEILPDYAEAYSNLLFSPELHPDYHASHYLEEASRYGRMVAKKVDVNSWMGCFSQLDRLCFGRKVCPSTRDSLSTSMISIFVVRYGKKGCRWEHGRSRLPIKVEGLWLG